MSSSTRLAASNLQPRSRPAEEVPGRQAPMFRRSRSVLSGTACHLFSGVLAAVFLIPLIRVTLNSIKSSAEANQVLVSFADRDWTFSGPDANVFGLEPHFACCTANLHQGWPKLVRSLWMSEADDALVATAYGPCRVQTEMAEQPVVLDVRTGYSFEETVEVRVTLAEPATFGLRFQVPAWCTGASLAHSGTELDAAVDAEGYLSVRRTWADGDLVTLVLPMTLRTVPRDDGGRAPAGTTGDGERH